MVVTAMVRTDPVTVTTRTVRMKEARTSNLVSIGSVSRVRMESSRVVTSASIVLVRREVISVREAISVLTDISRAVTASLHRSVRTAVSA